MIDAKLVAMTLTIGMVVTVAINYVGRSDTVDSVDYTDDWDKRLEFMCKATVDDGSCFVGLCKAYSAGQMDSTTELLIQCGDGSFRSSTLRELHNNEDWYERARGESGNTQAPMHATEEYCARTEGANFNAGAFTFTGLESRSETNVADNCAFSVPIFAAVVDAEYTRYVSRHHIAEFQAGFDMFCAINNETMAGCEEATQGFRDSNREFTATCDDGSLALFNFHQTVLSLDKLKHAEASDEEIEAFIRGHCGNTEGDARRLGARKFHSGKKHEDELAAEIEELENSSLPEHVSKVAGLRDMLEQQKPNARDEEESHGRALWGHGHNPHGHNPHGHSPHNHGTGDAADCHGCGNICGNNCYGRCGPGCSRWNSCGGNGNGAHRACVEHDYECSCQSIVTNTCLMLIADGIASTFRDIGGGGNCELAHDFVGTNCEVASSAPGGSIATIKRINMAVRAWGSRYGLSGQGNDFTDGNTNVNSHACSKVEMCSSRGGYNRPDWTGTNIRNDCSDGWASHNRGDGKSTTAGVVTTVVTVVLSIGAFLMGF